MTPTKVVNVRRSSFHIYIGRPSKWGNPYLIGVDGAREEVIEKYRKHLEGKPKLLAALPELRGKTLGCYCKPLPCHGDILAELADRSLEE